MRAKQPNLRLQTFLARAQQVQSTDEARQLCEEELVWIYAHHDGTGPHGVVNKYRKALRAANLLNPFLERTATIVEEGNEASQVITLPGYMREYEDQVKDRAMMYRASVEQRKAYVEEYAILHGRETAYVQRARQLLDTASWTAQAVGLAMLTGRRNVEVCLTALMLPSAEHPYWVAYSGQVKTRSAERLDEWRDIPVLAPAHVVCTALGHVQTHVTALTEGEIDAETFDGRFGRDMRRAVHTYIRDLFPPGVQLSPRTLRNIYVSICLQAALPNGEPLCVYKDSDDLIGHILGHQHGEYRSRDAYKSQLIPVTERTITLPE